MKKLFAVAALALMAGWILRAQISSVSYSVIPSTGLAIACPAPTIGSTIYCQAADKFQVSANGTPYVTIWPAAPIVTGVTSISVNGGTAQTGPVVLTIPTKATSTSTTTTLTNIQ